MSMIFSLLNRMTVFPSLEADTGSSMPDPGVASRNTILPSGSHSSGAPMLSAGKDGTSTVGVSSSVSFPGASSPFFFAVWGRSCARQHATTEKVTNRRDALKPAIVLGQKRVQLIGNPVGVVLALQRGVQRSTAPAGGAVDRSIQIRRDRKSRLVSFSIGWVARWPK